MRQTRTGRVEQAAKLSLGITICVVAGKLGAGFLTGSVSVLAEALQSSVDVLVAFGVVQAVRLAALPPDEEHNYGHGKAEVLLSAMQMILIMASAGFILSKAYGRLLKPEAIQTDWGLIVMGASAAVNFYLSKRLGKIAREESSAALRGESFHLMGDAYSSAGVFVGLLLVLAFNSPILDPITAIVFTFVVVFLAIRQLREILHQLMDGAVSATERQTIEGVLKSDPRVLGFHAIRTRTVGSVHHVDLHILLDDDLTFIAAHDLAEEVEELISNALGGAFVNAHFEPYFQEMEHRRQVHADAESIVTKPKTDSN